MESPTNAARQYAEYLRHRKNDGKGLGHLAEKIIVLDNEIKRLERTLYEERTPPAWRGDWARIG